MSVKMRQEVERKIARAAADGILSAGFKIIVNDGEEDVTGHLESTDDVLKAMFTTDEDYMVVVTRGDFPIQFGWVRFIYGNDGWDVINDYSVSLKKYLAKANEIAESYS